MKILAVDNHPVMVRYIQSLLEKKGHEVKTAHDGLEALEVLKTFVPEVIFVDLIMPKIDGKKLCLAVRQREALKDVHIVVLSAVALEEAEDFRVFGADACIAKGPLDLLGPNILEVLDAIQSGAIQGSEEIKGREYVYQRTITKELIYSKQHFEVILNNMSEGILEITVEGYIYFANRAASCILSIPEERLLGAQFFDFFQEPEKEAIETGFRKCLEERKSCSPDGPVEVDTKRLLVSFLPVLEQEGNGIMVMLADVTEKMKIEEQLKHAMKMEAIGKLSGGIAHDFNNLLMGIQGNVSVMLLETKPSQLQYECIKKIESIIRSGSELTDKLLGYARKGKYETKVLNLNKLIRESAEMFGRTKKEILMQIDLAADLLPVEGDRVQFEQVLLNLYVNAWQAMPEGGTLRIETQNVSHEEIESRLFNPKPGQYARVVIADTGSGIDETLLHQVFDPFFTTKELGRGTGLGLASVYGIVKNHGGYIDVESEKGKGTTFLIYLPVSEKPLSEKEGALRYEPENETILLIDDEEMVLEAGLRMLRILGYEVLLAKNGKEAIEIFRENAGVVSLVILDMIMPKMSGAETYEKLKEIRKDVKVLISSGYSMNGLPERVNLDGNDGFIQKPYELKHLFHKLREMLGDRIGEQQRDSE
jgi:PAS domain S-box-containing protein